MVNCYTLFTLLTLLFTCIYNVHKGVNLRRIAFIVMIVDICFSLHTLYAAASEITGR